MALKDELEQVATDLEGVNTSLSQDLENVRGVVNGLKEDVAELERIISETGSVPPELLGRLRAVAADLKAKDAQLDAIAPDPVVEEPPTEVPPTEPV